MSYIQASLEGRILGFLLLSMLIWIFELFALFLFIKFIPLNGIELVEEFMEILLSGLLNSGQELFGIYQSLAIFALTILFIPTFWFWTKFKN
jgi:hypothetical protein